MRTANNTNNFTVEALVAKYRNFVNEKVSIKGDPLFDKQIERYADHQLLIALYVKAVGHNADSYIMGGLSAYYNAFKKEALTEEELTFLCNNLKGVVEYIFSDKLFGINEPVWYAMKDLRADNASLSIIGKIAKASEADKVYIAEDIMGDIAMLFPKCTIILEERKYKQEFTYLIEDTNKDREENALKMIRFFAHGIHSEVTNNIKNEEIDILIRRFPDGLKDHNGVHLSSNGKALFLLHSEQLLGTDWQAFRDQITSSKKVKAILKYKQDGYVMVAEKTDHTILYMVDELSGLSKEVPYEIIDKEVLLPNYYLIEKPATWIPLSTFVDSPSVPRIDSPGSHWGVRSTNKVLLQKELGVSFEDADIRKKNLYSVSDLTETSNSWGGMDFMGWYSNKIPCVYLWGFENNYRIGYDYEADSVVEYALPYQMSVLIPKDSIDIRYIAALLLIPEVKKQIESLYCGDHIASMMGIIIKHVYIPNHTDIERETFLGETNHSAMAHLVDDLKNVQEAYVKAIRLRKHALTQSLSSIESMFYALNVFRNKQKGVLHDDDVISRIKGTTVKDAFDYLSKGIEDMMPALEHIAEIEYSFAKPEWIDPERFIEEYISKNENGWLNFKPVIMWRKENNQVKEDIKDAVTGDILLKKGTPVNLFYFPKDALEKIFKNVISNAKAHGFYDSTRKDYLLRFSWHTDGVSLIIEIENNGAPISNDRDTTSLFEYGVSTKLHQEGHNGIGCNEIADIIHRYDGDVDIISTPNEEYTVKYILTFHRSLSRTI